MTEPEVCVLAFRALDHVVQQIRDDQWDLAIPDWFAMSSAAAGQPYVLRDIIGRHAWDLAWVPDTLTGARPESAGADKFDGDLLGDDPRGVIDQLSETAADAVMGADLDRPVHLSYGIFPAREYLQHIAYFHGVRARDIARVVGVDDHLPDALVQGLWDQMEPQADEWRSWGVFGPKVPVPDTAPLQDRLIGLTGRQP